MIAAGENEMRHHAGDAKRSGERRRDDAAGPTPRERAKTSKDVGKALDESFPASDPPSYNPGAANPRGD